MIKYTRDKALKACYVAKSKSKSAGRVTPRVSLQLFDSFVTPVLEYACEIWYNGTGNVELEKIQLRFIKGILGVKNSTATAAIYAETGRADLLTRQKIRILKYWLRLERMDNSKLVKMCLNMQKHMSELGFNTWFSHVNNILFECKIEASMSYSISQATNSLNICKVNLHDNFVTKCMKTLQQMPVLRSYVNFKTVFKLESYLYVIKDFKLRKCMSKLRLSSHSLNIERGRHTKPKTPLEDRLCTVCDKSEVEDEFHFLLKCPLYNIERACLLKVIFEAEPSMQCFSDLELFYNILASENERILFCVCKFIQKGFKKR
jgi:hypothetical protein